MSDEVSEKFGEMLGYMRGLGRGRHIGAQANAAELWRDLGAAARAVLPLAQARDDLASAVELLRAVATLADEGAALEQRLFEAGVPTSLRHVRRERQRHVARFVKSVRRFEPRFPETDSGESVSRLQQLRPN